MIAAYVGIKAVNSYVEKSGKQSIIAILLVIVLVFALLSLPLNFYLDQYYAENEEYVDPGEVSEF